ncbi:Choline transport protein [Lasiodiplodia hormozganensis]|uniref:Choline transport protein n=1 Tax=Lasiodiplodia hormozganensis TaxID=869390 RepID=A0AA39XQF9_9PEZI|nr:Choline transport protein [Lasiodiplodia hormozganensis]
MLVFTKDKHSSDYVFTTFLNSSGWTNSGVAFCTGLSTPMFGFGGLEKAAHFSEEIRHVRKSVPRAIFWTALINAFITFPWLIVLLYCSGDISSVINSPIGLVSPFTQILFNSTGNPGLSIFLASLSTYLAFVGGIDAQGSCARTLWAMARDDAFPAPFRSVHPRWEVPVCCIVVSAVAQLAIGAIYIGNSTAFYGLISGVLALYMLTYAMAIGLHTTAKFGSSRKIEYGPWALGRLSLPLNVVALAWAVFTIVFLCFPLYRPVTAGNM